MSRYDPSIHSYKVSDLSVNKSIGDKIYTPIENTKNKVIDSIFYIPEKVGTAITPEPLKGFTKGSYSAMKKGVKNITDFPKNIIKTVGSALVNGIATPIKTVSKGFKAIGNFFSGLTKSKVVTS